MADDSRVPCRTPGCANLIQPATALRNDGFCGPCAGRRAHEAREAYIRANRRDVDRFAGVSDPVELLLRIHQPPRPDPLVNLLPPPQPTEAIYRSLTPAEIRRLSAAIFEQDGEDQDAVVEVAACLAAFTDSPLDVLQHALLDRFDAWPSITFRGAAADVRNRLIYSLKPGGVFATLRRLAAAEGGRGTSASHVLAALAYVGDDTTTALLVEADRERPGWSPRSSWSPADYARVAGWEVVDGQRRDLTLGGCVAVKLAEPGEPGDVGVRVWARRDDRCPWCGGALANLVELDLTAPPLDAFAAALGPRVEVATCPLCTCYGVVHATLDADGRGRWSPTNVRPKFLSGDVWAGSEWTAARVRLEPRGRYGGAEWTLPTTLTQVGGVPGWVQSPEYPRCATCQQTMTFIAQVDEAAFPHNEGVTYAFACLGCRTTATTYQQT